MRIIRECNRTERHYFIVNKKIIVVILVACCATGIAAYVLISRHDHVAVVNTPNSSFKDATYTIEGQSVPLVNGEYATSSAPGSASQTITKYFGNDATGDLNGDGIPDVGFILTQSSGGSGTFYYAVAALKSGSGYIGTNAILLGDRIAPQTTEIKDGVLIANYADRAPSDPMTTAPSVGVSKLLLVKNGMLVEVPALVSALYPLYTGVNWGSVTATTSPDYGTVAVLQSIPLTNITDIATKSTPFMSYNHTQLVHAGWVEDIQREAGGPGTETTVYKKGDQFIVTAFHSVFHDQQPSGPAQCPCDVQFTLMNGLSSSSQ